VTFQLEIQNRNKKYTNKSPANTVQIISVKLLPFICNVLAFLITRIGSPESRFKKEQNTNLFKFDEGRSPLFSNQNNLYGFGRDSRGFITAERMFLGTILYSRAPLTRSRWINGRKLIPGRHKI